MDQGMQGALGDDDAISGVSRERDTTTPAPRADDEQTLIDVGTTGVGAVSFELNRAATRLHEGHARADDIGTDHVPGATLGLDDELVRS